MNASGADDIVIGCAADRNYVRPLAAMIKSVLTNIKTQRMISLYVVDGGISQEDKKRLLHSWASDQLAVHWVWPDESLLRQLPLWGRMNLSTYHRLVVSDLLPHTLPKAIWLDADLVVTENLAKLWDLEMGDQGVLAVQDMVIPYVSSRYGIAAYKELGIPADARYFNAGVMVVNLDWWRLNDVMGRAFAYLRTYRNSVFFWDQEGLNAVLFGKWGGLDPRWNQIASVCGRSFFRSEHLDKTTYQQVVEDPWVVHFAGSWKPWIYHNHNPFRALYFRYLDMTAWTGWRPRKTLKSVALGIYDSSLRGILYPVERWRIEFLRMRALSKHDAR